MSVCAFVSTSRYSFLFVNSMPSTPSPTLTCDNKIKLKIYFIMHKLKHNNPISHCGRGVCWYLVLIILFFPYNFPLFHPAPPIPNCPNPKSTITQNQLYCFCKNDNANHPTHPHKLSGSHDDPQINIATLCSNLYSESKSVI